MTILVAIDSHALNQGLKYKTRQQNNDSAFRLKIDYSKLLAYLSDKTDTTIINYYTDQAKPDLCSRLVGHCYRWKKKSGFGFIVSTNGDNYFVHHSQLQMRGFKHLKKGQVVSFESSETANGLEATEVKVERNANTVDLYHRLRKEKFLEMLEATGYNIVRCLPSRDPTKKSRSIGIKMSCDALNELGDPEDRLVLVADDPALYELVSTLKEDCIHVTVVAFKSPASQFLCEMADAAVYLDEILDEIILRNEDSDLSSELSDESLVTDEEVSSNSY